MRVLFFPNIIYMMSSKMLISFSHIVVTTYVEYKNQVAGGAIYYHLISNLFQIRINIFFYLPNNILDECWQRLSDIGLEKSTTNMVKKSISKLTCFPPSKELHTSYIRRKRFNITHIDTFFLQQQINELFSKNKFIRRVF